MRLFDLAAIVVPASFHIDVLLPLLVQELGFCVMVAIIDGEQRLLATNTVHQTMQLHGVKGKTITFFPCVLVSSLTCTMS